MTHPRSVGIGEGAGAVPRLASAMLEVCLSDCTRDAIIGDLAEEFAERMAIHGRRPARRWYWSQVVRSLWPVSTFHSHGGAARVISSVLFGAATMWLIGGWVLPDLAAAARTRWSPAVIPAGWWHVGYILCAAPSAALGGYAAAWRGTPNATLVMFILAGIVAAPVAWPMLNGTAGWAQAVWLVLGPVAVIRGGHEFALRHSRT